MKKLLLLCLVWLVNMAYAPVNHTPTNPRFDFEKQVGFILPTLPDSAVLVVHDGYTVGYNPAYLCPSWVAYPLLPEEILGTSSREGETFRPDTAVHSGTAFPRDYSKSGFDIGYMAPAADFKFSASMMHQTFLLSNACPQRPECNRIIWEHLENLIRTWAIRDSGLYVITGPVLKPGLPTIGKSHVVVPEQFYKVILYCNAPDIRMIGFLMANQGSKKPLKSFVVPVDSVEHLTGLQFFPMLPDSLSQVLKSADASTTTRAWF